MTETEYGFIGAQIVSLAYSLTRWIEEATDAERNEQGFKWCMPRECDPFDRNNAKDKRDA